MSATTYELHFGTQETVNLTKEKRFVNFKIGGSTLICVDLLLGRASLLNPKSITTLQKKNCFNRFFHLVKASRFLAENTDDGLVVKDRRSGLIISQHRSKITLTIPTRSAMIILSHFSNYDDAPVQTLLYEWNKDFEQEQKQLEIIEVKSVQSAINIPF